MMLHAASVSEDQTDGCDTQLLAHTTEHNLDIPRLAHPSPLDLHPISREHLDSFHVRHGGIPERAVEE